MVRRGRVPLNWVPPFPAFSLGQAIHVDPLPYFGFLGNMAGPHHFDGGKEGDAVGSHYKSQAQEELRFAS